MLHMKCEICNSHSIIKAGGIFVCQNCSCKYAVEDARKLIKQAPQDVEATKVQRKLLNSPKKQLIIFIKFLVSVLCIMLLLLFISIAYVMKTRSTQNDSYYSENTDIESPTLSFLETLNSESDIIQIEITADGGARHDITTSINTNIQLTANTVPEYSTDKIVWTTNDSSVVTVDESGYMTAVGYGRTTITAYAPNGVNSKIVVRVVDMVERENSKNGSGEALDILERHEEEETKRSLEN